MPTATPPRRPTLLVILDGVGINPSKINNAFAAADTPRLDEYFRRYPMTQLAASGSAVGLPEGQMGNSEVGHLTMGTGSIQRQDLVRIDEAIADKSIYRNPALCAAVARAKQANKPLHLLGLISDGGVHSHLRHLLAMLELCRRSGVTPLLHAITDGRDTPPQCAINQVNLIEAALARSGGTVASVCGRFYAMDRDQRWERTEAAWQAITQAHGRRARSLRQAIESAYALGETDEFIKPIVLPGAQPLDDADTLVFFNFRKDRTRQLSAALSSPDFTAFDRGTYSPVSVTCMTEYDPALALPYAFAPEQAESTLAETIYHAGLSQFHCAETEKFAHVTYFFNGGRNEPYPNEERLLVPSPQVETYDQQPEMSAAAVADAVIAKLRGHQHAFIVVNFANGDMVGHSAVREAVIRAVEALDREVGRLLDVAVQEDWSVILSADHGNCEQLVDPETGKPHTQHTVNPVPCMIIDQVRWKLAPEGGLKDIAPTVLQLMGIQQPGAMTGRSLLLQPADTSSAAA